MRSSVADAARQRMYDDGELTAEEIAGVVGVARSTL